ncbi:MAG: hypothetical protein AB8B55_16830 [Mariniblastus sp.]
MKKVSFLVAFLAFLQIASGMQALGQERLSEQNRRTIEEALDLAGDDIGKEVEELLRQLELSADKFSQTFERWAEENSDELEAWSDKYSGQWESWSENFGRSVERLVEEQEGVWAQWAQRYEGDVERWADTLERDGLKAGEVGELVERNLKMLSKMPLGQLVDRAMEEGLGELSEAPWQSLGELGDLAQNAFEKPMGEIIEVLDGDSVERRSLERSARELSRALGQLQDDVGRNISDSTARQDSKIRDRKVRDSKTDPRIEALQRLLRDESVTAAQRERIQQAIRTIRDARLLAGDQPASSTRVDLDIPKRDQILEKIRREKLRHAETLRAFNEDLQRSSEESRDAMKAEARKSNAKARERDVRSPKRSDGKSLDLNSPQSSKSKQDSLRWLRKDARSNRTNQQSTGRTSGQRSDSASDGVRAGDQKKKSNREMTEYELLRSEIENLRKELGEMKKLRSDK